MQDTKSLPQPIGVVYNTSMARPDAALALAALYVSSSRREARVGGICVTGAGLDAAIFCDIVARFYSGQARTPSSNNALPIGLPASPAVPPSAQMVDAAVKRTREDGTPQYTRTIQRPADTAAPDALLRNAITFSAESVVVLSAPATWLAKSIGLAGTLAQYKQRVKRVVLVEAGGIGQDASALNALVAALPPPVLLCGREVGEALAIARARLDSGFTWAPANPVADACRAANEPAVAAHDVAALHYALHPASGFFNLSDPGTLSAGDDGGVRFSPSSSGTVRRLVLDQSRKDECLAALGALATAKPAPPPARAGG
jgi:hypothetical protein